MPVPSLDNLIFNAFVSNVLYGSFSAAALKLNARSISVNKICLIVFIKSPSTTLSFSALQLYLFCVSSTNKKPLENEHLELVSNLLCLQHLNQMQ